MESLTPFIRRQLEDAPGPSSPPEEAGSRASDSRRAQSRPNRVAALSSRRHSRMTPMCSCLPRASSPASR